MVQSKSALPVQFHKHFQRRGYPSDAIVSACSNTSGTCGASRGGRLRAERSQICSVTYNRRCLALQSSICHSQLPTVAAQPGVGRRSCRYIRVIAQPQASSELIAACEVWTWRQTASTKRTRPLQNSVHTRWAPQNRYAGASSFLLDCLGKQLDCTPSPELFKKTIHRAPFSQPGQRWPESALAQLPPRAGIHRTIRFGLRSANSVCPPFDESGCLAPFGQMLPAPSMPDS